MYMYGAYFNNYILKNLCEVKKNNSKKMKYKMLEIKKKYQNKKYIY